MVDSIGEVPEIILRQYRKTIMKQADVRSASPIESIIRRWFFQSRSGGIGKRSIDVGGGFE